MDSSDFNCVLKPSSLEQKKTFVNFENDEYEYQIVKVLMFNN